MMGCGECGSVGGVAAATWRVSTGLIWADGLTGTGGGRSAGGGRAGGKERPIGRSWHGYGRRTERRYGDDGERRREPLGVNRGDGGRRRGTGRGQAEYGGKRQ